MVTVEVNRNNLKLIENRLGNLKNKSKEVLKKAVNDTAKQARKELAQQAQKTYVVKNGKFNKAMKIKKASNSNPTAIISATGGAMELMDFKVSQINYVEDENGKIKEKKKAAKFRTGLERGNAISAKVLKKGGMKKLIKGDIKAFVTKFSNGHVSVLQRIGKKRLPVKKLLSPSIPKMIGNEKRVFKVVKPNIDKNLRDNINKHIEKVLGG